MSFEIDDRIDGKGNVIIFDVELSIEVDEYDKISRSPYYDWFKCPKCKLTVVALINGVCADCFNIDDWIEEIKNDKKES